MITVYLADIRHLPSEKKHTAYLLNLILKESGIPAPEILIGPHGKPYLANIPNLYFNGSHSGAYLVCALSDTPVGIDLQKILPHKNFEGLIRRFMTPEDLHQFKHCPKSQQMRYFYDLWAGKESYIKYLGTGFKTPLNRFFRLPLNRGWGILDSGCFVKDLMLLPIPAPADYVLWVCGHHPDIRIISRKIT